MTQSNQKNLKQELKELIITECERDCEISEIKDDEELFGPNSRLLFNNN